MRVLRVELEAPTASFRYPHFMVGRHPTFAMPPPATLYGLLCAAVGDTVPPESLRLGFRFTAEAEANDLEHLHIITPKGAKSKFDWQGEKLPYNTEGTVTPTTRDFLFNTKLTLYLDRPDLADAFRCPHYAISLGRSQDLASIREVAEIELQPAECAYLEHTLLPAQERLWIGQGVVLTMPRFLEPTRGRAPQFDHYLMLPRRVYAYQTAGPLQELGEQRARRVPEGQTLWVDPDSPEDRGARRAVWLHGLA